MKPNGMYEVIWSHESDCYLLRPMNVNSSVKPLFIGTRDECAGWIVKNAKK